VGVAAGDGERGVTQHVLDDADVDALLEQERRRRVPGVVDA